MQNFYLLGFQLHLWNVKFKYVSDSNPTEYVLKLDIYVRAPQGGFPRFFGFLAHCVLTLRILPGKAKLPSKSVTKKATPENLCSVRIS